MSADTQWITGVLTGVILTLCFTRPRVLNFMLRIYVWPFKKLRIIN